MRKVFIISGLVFLGYALEILLFNFLGAWFKPNLLILLVVFFNLRLGIRYSLWVAFLAGFLKDSFAASPFGLHIFSFVVCSYVITLIKQYFYEAGYTFSRILLAFLATLFSNLLMYAVYATSAVFDFHDVAWTIFFPELLITTVISVAAFHRLRLFVLRLAV